MRRREELNAILRARRAGRDASRNPSDQGNLSGDYAPDAKVYVDNLLVWPLDESRQALVDLNQKCKDETARAWIAEKCARDAATPAPAAGMVEKAKPVAWIDPTDRDFDSLGLFYTARAYAGVLKPDNEVDWRGVVLASDYDALWEALRVAREEVERLNSVRKVTVEACALAAAERDAANQRAEALQAEVRALKDWRADVTVAVGWERIPVLVVPEAAVTKCHFPARKTSLDWCPDCGSKIVNGRWQRPRILRVARSK
jgi:hypothetical protein